jgi:hypothetical protein
MSFAYMPIILAGQVIGLVGGAGGGAGIGVTVGASGASYTSVAAAAAAQQPVVHIISNVYESGLITVPNSGLMVHLYYDSTWSLGTFGMDVPGSRSVQIDGDGQMAYGTIARGIVINGSGMLSIENINIVNSGSSPAPCLTNIDYVRINNVLFDGDVRICGDYNIYSDSIYRNGQLTIDSGTINDQIAAAIFQNYIVANSGTNSILSDILAG